MDELRALFPNVPFVEVSELVERSLPPGTLSVPPGGYTLPMETTVKTYKNPRAYQRDLRKMQRQGWMPQNTMDHHRDRSLMYKLFMPYGWLSRGKDRIVVTYQRVK